jgi:hypothetical protein
MVDDGAIKPLPKEIVAMIGNFLMFDFVVPLYRWRIFGRPMEYAKPSDRLEAFSPCAE